MDPSAIVHEIEVALTTAFWEFVTFVPMLKVLFAIVVGILWSGVLKIFASKGNREIKWWMQHTTPMYLILWVTLMCELITFKIEVDSHSDARACLSDPDLPDCALDVMAQVSHATTNRSLCMTNWINDENLNADSLWVGYVALCAPFFAIITFIVNAVATFRHVLAAEKESLWSQGNRAATIWILQLPVVYSMTALFSVEKGLRLARLGGYTCTMVGDSSLAFLSEAGLSFGDGYEAIALLLFADITMNVIEHVVDKTVQDAEGVKAALLKIEAKIAKVLPDNVILIKQLGDVKGHTIKTLTRLEQMSEHLVHSTWALSTLGIQYFALTCLLMSIPQLLACQALAWNWGEMFSTLQKFSQDWEVTFKGMGLLGSCVAIHNMVSIETHFDEAFLGGFEAKKKFISVKIMVSIVFIQEMVLPTAFDLSLPRAALFDASLRIIEFTFISVFNLWAWPLKQDFYKMEAIEIAGMEGLTESLVSDERLGFRTEDLEQLLGPSPVNSCT